MRITNDVFAACLECKYKAWRILQGEQGVSHAYEEMMTELQEEHKSLASAVLLTKFKLSSAPTRLRLTEVLLSEGHPLILDTLAEHGQLSVHCDALHRVDAKSALGNTLYEPVLFNFSDKIRSEQRLCLSLVAYAISKVQGIHPTRGKIIFGKHCSVMTVQLANLNKKMLDIVHVLLRMLRGESKPTLFLNKHCNICEYYDKCQEEATATDALSRLRGITEKEVERQKNRGIFTVEQYSYTYRPRKRRTKINCTVYFHFRSLTLRGANNLCRL